MQLNQRETGEEDNSTAYNTPDGEKDLDSTRHGDSADRKSGKGYIGGHASPLVGRLWRTRLLSAEDTKRKNTPVLGRVDEEAAEKKRKERGGKTT